MSTINANTKIASIIKQHPGALEAIVSLSPKFEKLRNPILRKFTAESFLKYIDVNGGQGQHCYGF